MEGCSRSPQPPPPFTQVAAKKDNARLRQEVTHLKDEGAALAADAAAARNASAAQAAALERSTRRASVAGQAAGAGGGEDSLDEATAQVLRSVAAERAGAAGGSALASGDEARYKDVITRLTRILDAERRATRAVRLAKMASHARPRPLVPASVFACCAGATAARRRALCAHGGRDVPARVGRGGAQGHRPQAAGGRRGVDGVPPACLCERLGANGCCGRIDARWGQPSAWRRQQRRRWKPAACRVRVCVVEPR